MSANSLGPHSFASPPHEPHHEWLTKFSPKQRHQLMEEDLEARTNVARVFATTMLFGMAISIVVLVVAYCYGLM